MCERSVVGVLETTKSGVKTHWDGDAEASSVRAHASEGGHRCRATEDQHCSHNDVGHETEHQESKVSLNSPSHMHNFENRVDTRALVFDLDGEYSEEEDLDRGARSIPIRARDTVLSGDV